MRAIFILFVLLLATVNAQAQTCADGQSPIWSSTTGWTCGAVTPGPLPAGSSLNMTIANAGVTGTTINRFAKLTGAPSTAVISSNGDTDGAVGVVVSGAGTTGNAVIAIIGQVSCEFDNATVAGDYVTIGATGGRCHDAGSTYVTATANYGRALSTNGGAGTYVMELMTPDIAFQNGGGGKSRPGGGNTQVQYNNNNIFGGITNATSDGTTLTVTSPRVVTAINDTNGNPVISITPTASAVNGISITNGIAGSPGTVDLGTSGSDSSINLTLTPKGTGSILTSNSHLYGVTVVGTIKAHLGSTGVFISTSGGGVNWSNSSASTGTVDTGLARNGVNIAEVNNGSGTVFAWLKTAGRNRVTTQTDKTNTTLADVTGTSRSLLTTQSWAFEFEANYDADLTGGQKWAVVYSGTTSAIAYYIQSVCDATNLNVITSRQTASGGSAGQAGCTAGHIRIMGNLTTTGAGNFSIQFAQNAANGTSSVLAPGSMLNIWPTSN